MPAEQSTHAVATAFPLPAVLPLPIAQSVHPACPVWSWYLPPTQSMHAALLDDGPNLPAAHEVHAVATALPLPAVLVLPVPQSVHEPCPVWSWYLPPTQSLHAALTANWPYLPVAHDVHAVATPFPLPAVLALPVPQSVHPACPVWSWYLPPLQTVHSMLPFPFAYFPAAHSVQVCTAEAPADAYLPWVHASALHSDCPSSFVYFPAVHSEHFVCPSVPWNLPLGQVVQAWHDALSDEWYSPSEHVLDLQLSCPFSSWYFPVKHVVHVVVASVEAEKKPAAQRVHLTPVEDVADDPAVSTTDPAGHVWARHVPSS